MADPLRDRLLFGTGHLLEDAVHDVLVEAGATVTRLDAVYGTNSADLVRHMPLLQSCPDAQPGRPWPGSGVTYRLNFPHTVLTIAYAGTTNA